MKILMILAALLTFGATAFAATEPKVPEKQNFEWIKKGNLPETRNFEWLKNK